VNFIPGAARFILNTNLVKTREDCTNYVQFILFLCSNSKMVVINWDIKNGNKGNTITVY
jgi:hypothetical protein